MTEPVHAIFGRPMGAPAPQGFEEVVLGMGCYWGVERLFWQQDGVWLTEVGFAGGDVQNPTYDQVKRGDTGHAEVVRVIYDSSLISYDHLLQLFWENHDPTQGDRQGNDVGSSYRSAIFPLSDEQERVARDTIADVDASGLWPGSAVTTIEPAGPFWEAEPEHQDYLQRYPNGYNCHYPRAGWVLPRRIQATEASV